MALFRKKPVVVEAITFEELIEYGKANTENIVKGMPWSFIYNGCPVSHETDECYLLITRFGGHNMTPADMLITGVDGEMYPCAIEKFKELYEPAE